jgi:diketogulonate reductase-like aldo/keto reductase
LFDGKRVPIIGLGTWAIGGEERADRSRDEQSVGSLKHALELGYIHIDTAEVYAAGHSEELVGQAIQGWDRAKLFITTKVDPKHLHYDRAWKALEGSLKRLNTEYVDLYLIHWPNDSIPMEETFSALNEMVEQRKVKYLGVSNFSLEQLKRAKGLSKTPIVANQVPYSLEERQYAENGVLDYCQKQGILLTAYWPIRRSDLQNPFLNTLAVKYEATCAQIALAWLVGQKGVITIPKSTDPLHLKENLRAADIELSPVDMDGLSRL